MVELTFEISKHDDPNKGYTLLIGEENGAQSYVVWDLEQLSDNESRLTITVVSFHTRKTSQNTCIPATYFVGKT